MNQYDFIATSPQPWPDGFKILLAAAALLVALWLVTLIK